MHIVLLLVLLFLPLPAFAQAQGTMCSTGRLGPVACIRPDHVAFDICQHIESASRRHVLNPGFFARLIWQESRFDPNALSPAGAQGIAQFMPGTAKLRDLKDSYNPAEALERSAHYLAELTRRYGNQGMAAVAYNGGEGRADGFLRGGGLARETINYVRIVTGLNAEDWRDRPPKGHDFRLDKTKTFLPACLAMAQGRKVSPLGPPPSRWKPWGVQVGYGVTEKDARARVARFTRSCSAQISDGAMEYIPVSSRVKGRKPYIMARLGRSSRQEANDLCRAISRAGCICRVYRNPS
ncbi:MAG: lytic transglycosylase domain-containing protein [Tateyamaria sp.]|uniref:lytic transglycosylase domain-containing protein n=1 Tax=Tateyamaria sp. TaxID=1929288 RepID=UPI00329EA0AB